jgi:hypothetical protein
VCKSTKSKTGNAAIEHTRFQSDSTRTGPIEYLINASTILRNSLDSSFASFKKVDDAKPVAPYKCKEQYKQDEMQHQKSRRKLPTEKCFLCDKPPVDCPFVEELPRKVECPFKVSRWVRREKRVSKNDLITSYTCTMSTSTAFNTDRTSPICTKYTNAYPGANSRIFILTERARLYQLDDLYRMLARYHRRFKSSKMLAYRNTIAMGSLNSLRV